MSDTIDVDEVQVALDIAAYKSVHGTSEDRNGRYKGPAEVVRFPGSTKVDIPAANVLAGAASSDLKEAIVIGRHEDGSAFYASSLGDAGHILLELEKFKKLIMEAYVE